MNILLFDFVCNRCQDPWCLGPALLGVSFYMIDIQLKISILWKASTRDVGRIRLIITFLYADTNIILV